MKTVKITIERSKDAYWAYSENVPGISGVGETPDQAKQSALNSIQIIKEINDTKNIPSILKGKYKIVYRFDTESLLKYYSKIFKKPAIASITGINEKQLHHYSTGFKKPRPAQMKKIETAFHNLGAELLTVHL